MISGISVAGRVVIGSGSTGQQGQGRQRAGGWCRGRSGAAGSKSAHGRAGSRPAGRPSRGKPAILPQTARPCCMAASDAALTGGRFGTGTRRRAGSGRGGNLLRQHGAGRSGPGRRPSEGIVGLSAARKAVSRLLGGFGCTSGLLMVATQHCMEFSKARKPRKGFAGIGGQGRAQASPVRTSHPGRWAACTARPGMIRSGLACCCSGQRRAAGGLGIGLLPWPCPDRGAWPAKAVSGVSMHLRYRGASSAPPRAGFSHGPPAASSSPSAS